MGIQVAIITGEASGDRVGAQLAQEIRRLRPDVTLWGTGGRFLREAGVETVVDSSRWGVIGIIAGMRILPRVLHARQGLNVELQRRRPDVVVPVDAGAFNIGFAGMEGLCPWLRHHLPETKILYYFPPGSWRRNLKSTPLAGLADRVATPFPWSEAELRRFGVDATFVGHPLLDLVRPSESPEAFAERYGIDRERPVVGILPGSRSQEIAEVLPVQLAAASIIHQRVPGVQFLIGQAPTVERDEIATQIERERRRRDALRNELEKRAQLARREDPAGLGNTVPVPAEGGGGVGSASDLARKRTEWLQRAAEIPPADGDFPVAIVENATYDMMAGSDVLIIASGTATLEAAILGKPMVIVYRMAQANRIEYHFVKGRMPPFVGMPNILAGRQVCPEFVQDAATPDALAQEVIGLLLEPDRILRMRDDLRAAVAQLGQPGGAARTAKMVIDLAESSEGRPG